jgi:hypothetical protein
MLNTLKNNRCSCVFGYAAARGGLLEPSCSVLERLGAVLELRLVPMLRLMLPKMLRSCFEVASKRCWIDLKLFRSALDMFRSYFEELTLLAF